MQKLLFLIITVAPALFFFGCCEPKGEKEPQLAYIVAYSVLDKQYNTSSRLDLTADIWNGTSEDLKMVQLTVTDSEGKSYTLDYQDVGKFTQEGRYSAIPLDAPIQNKSLGGSRGVEHLADNGMNFLFMDSLESAVIRYQDSTGLHELQVRDLPRIVTKSREETIDWMRKEHEERERILEELKTKADAKISKRRAEQNK